MEWAPKDSPQPEDTESQDKETSSHLYQPCRFDLYFASIINAHLGPGISHHNSPEANRRNLKELTALAHQAIEVADEEIARAASPDDSNS